jgi:signal transduction histidine kinase
MANPSSSTEHTRIPNQPLPEFKSSKTGNRIDQRIREERFEAIRAFSQGVSHQFNNLLTPPLGELSILLAEPTARELSPTTVASLNEIKSSLVRIVRYINRLAQATGSTETSPTFSNLRVNPLILDGVKASKEIKGTHNGAQLQVVGKLED